MEKIVKEFKERLTEIEEGLETDFIAFEQQLLDLEEELYDTVDFMHTPREKTAIHHLLQRITYLKKEYDYFDADTERGYMFPNGEDED